MNFRKIFYTAVLTVFLLGCEDFLDNQPLGSLTDVSFPTTPADLTLAVNGVYNTLRIWNFHEGGYPITDIMSDDARKGSSPPDQLPTIGPFDNFTFDASDAAFDRWWRTLYQGVKRTAMVLESAPDIQMDNTLKTRLIAETRFLRGFFYFTLVTAWGDVPKVTTVNPERNLPRSPKAEIFNDIIVPDLVFAIENLPEKSDYSTADLGRATKGAARSVLAKAYLYNQDFVNAAKYALEVINSGQYSLDPSFGNTFSVEGEFGPGSIFEIGAVPENNIDAGGNQYANTMGVRGTPNLGWGFQRPTVDLINFFGNDPRMDATVIFVGEQLSGITIIGDINTPDVLLDPASGDTIELETYNQKVFVPGTDTRGTWGHNRRVIRYADVLLMAAEALNENDNPTEALVYLNQVRQRARGGDAGILPDITITEKDALRDAIINERRRELALEGHRYWDLVRTGKAPEVLGPLGFVEGRHELMPIPQSEIDISEGAITQNPDWD